MTGALDSFPPARCAPLRPSACQCDRPAPYATPEEWGEERYCAKCGRELRGTGERRRLQQLAFIAAHPDEQELFDESAFERFEVSAPACAHVRPGPDRGAVEQFLRPRSEPRPAADAFAPTGRAAHPPGGPVHPMPTIEGDHRVTHHPVR